MPERIQMSRKRPWRAEHPDAVIIARPSRWGNPYLVTSGRTAADAVRMFAESIVGKHDLIAEIRADLQGRDLACSCALDQPCHGDVLLKIANPPRGAS